MDHLDACASCDSGGKTTESCYDFEYCSCIKCPNGDPDVYAKVYNEVNNEDSVIRAKKNKIIKQNLLAISQYIYLPTNNSSSQVYSKEKDFLKEPTEIEYMNWFKKLENSKLSLIEKKNLLQNAVSSLSQYNNLSTQTIVKSILCTKLGELKMFGLPDSIFIQLSNKYIFNILSNLILEATYTQLIMELNYSEMFNLLYKYGINSIGKYRYLITRKISNEIENNAYIN